MGVGRPLLRRVVCASWWREDWRPGGGTCVILGVGFWGIAYGTLKRKQSRGLAHSKPQGEKGVWEQPDVEGHNWQSSPSSEAGRRDGAGRRCVRGALRWRGSPAPGSERSSRRSQGPENSGSHERINLRKQISPPATKTLPQQNPLLHPTLHPTNDIRAHCRKIV